MEIENQQIYMENREEKGKLKFIYKWKQVKENQCNYGGS